MITRKVLVSLAVAGCFFLKTPFATATTFSDLPDTTEFTLIGGDALHLLGGIRAVTTGDYDRDGDEDVFVVRFANEYLGVKQFVLYKNVSTPGHIHFEVSGNGDNGFPRFDQIVSTKNPAYWSTNTKATNFSGTVTADFNGDGWPDIFVGGSSLDTSRVESTWATTHIVDRSLLFINQQNASEPSFVEVGNLAGLTDVSSFCQGAAVADYNRDGLLDIFMANTSEFQSTRGPGAPNLLFLATGLASGGGVIYPTFTNATSTWTVLPDGFEHFGPTAGDFDKDGDLDVYICYREDEYPPDSTSHDPFSHNRLLVNSGTGFTDAGSSYKVDDNGNGYGSCWSDFDNDGDLDLLLANNQHHEEPGIKSFMNKLFVNQYPTARFDTLRVPGFAEPFAIQDNNGGFFFDYNLDELQDFVIAVEADASDWGTMLFHQATPGNFVEAAESEGAGLCTPPIRLKEGANSTYSDFDGDGDLDLFLTQASRDGVDCSPGSGSQPGVGTFVMENRTRTGQAGDPHFLTVRLKGGNRPDGVKALADGIGSQVFVYAAGGSFMQQVNAGAQDGSTFPMELTFGLGATTSVDSVVVRWRTFAGANPFRQKFTGPIPVNEPLLLKINPDTTFVPSDVNKIQDAISGTLPGAVVAVSGKDQSGNPKTYLELIVMKSGVKVIAQPGAGTPTIDANTLESTAVDFPDGAMSGTILEGFIVKGGTTQIVHLGPGSGIIRNCTIQASGTGATAGINITAGTGTIEGCTVTGALTTGIQIAGGFPSVVGCSVTNSGGKGIWVQGTACLSLNSSTLTPSGNGIVMGSSGTTTVTGGNLAAGGSNVRAVNGTVNLTGVTCTGGAEGILGVGGTVSVNGGSMFSGIGTGVSVSSGFVSIGTGSAISGIGTGVSVSSGFVSIGTGSAISGSSSAVHTTGGTVTIDATNLHDAETGIWTDGGTVLMTTGTIQNCVWGTWVNSNGHLELGTHGVTFPSLTISGCTATGAVADTTGLLLAEAIRVTGTNISGWTGIHFMPGSSGGLSWCEVKDASGAGSIGVFVESEVVLLGTKISNIAPTKHGHGIGMEISADSLDTVTVDTLSASGSWWSRTDIHNCYFGISIDGFARPVIRRADVQNNYKACVEIGPTTIPDLGRDTGGAGPGNCNIINTAPAMLAEGLFHLGEFSPVLAEKNWWGHSPPVSSQISSFVDFTPYLTGQFHPAGANVDIGPISGAAPGPIRSPYPVPFADRLTIPFRVTGTLDRVEISIYDLSGRRVRTLLNAQFAAGDYEAKWNGRGDNGLQVPKGMYFIRNKVGTRATSAKVLLAR